MIRKGTSLIELVIAIVVMGIGVMSLPLILTQTQNNNALALQQEAILATKAKLGFISSYPWDENSWDNDANTFRVLDTTSYTSSDDEFDTNNTIRRVGHIAQDNRRRLFNLTATNRIPSSIGKEGTDFNDTDDFNDASADENITVTAADLDYIFQLNLNPSVSYISDSTDYTSQNITFTFDANTSTTNETNIKMITVTTTDTSGVNIILRTFASNIGQSKILKRDW